MKARGFAVRVSVVGRRGARPRRGLDVLRWQPLRWFGASVLTTAAIAGLYLFVLTRGEIVR
jgi:hypothetical protein